MVSSIISALISKLARSELPDPTLASTVGRFHSRLSLVDISRRASVAFGQTGSLVSVHWLSFIPVLYFVLFSHWGGCLGLDIDIYL